jgi:UDP-glucose 4-epimerase
VNDLSAKNNRKGKLLVTGCSGFIGGNIARHAVNEGYEVVGLDRKECHIEGVKTFVGDIRNPELVNEATKGVQKIIHLAAITSNVEFEKDPNKCYAINVDGFINILDAARLNGVKKVIYASSAAVYTGDTGFSEGSYIDIKKQRNHYAKSKLINEMVADSYSDIYKMDIIGMRFFNVFGLGENEKGDYASIMSIFIRENANGRPLVIYGDGSQARDFIYVEDVAEIALLLLERGKEPIYNVGTGTAIQYEEIANIINKSNKIYIKNPLSSYQYLTKADTKRLLDTIGKFKFTSVKNGISKILLQTV